MKTIEGVFGVAVSLVMMLGILVTPVQLVTSTLTIPIKAIAYHSLGDGWEPGRTQVFWGYPGTGMFVVTSIDEHKHVSRGGILGFKQLL